MILKSSLKETWFLLIRMPCIPENVNLVNLEILVQMIVFLKCAQVLIFPWFGCVRLIELQPQNCRCRVYVDIYINKIKQVIKR